MNEMLVYKTLRDVLRPYLLKDYPGALMIRNNQSSLQGATTVPTIFMCSTSDKRVGFPRTDYIPRDALGMIIDTKTVQVIESRIKFMCLAPENPEQEGVLPTADDILRRFSMYLGADAIIAQLRKAGLKVLRVTDIPIPRFSNDYDTFQSNPTLDLVLQHEDILNLETPAIDRTELKVSSV